MESDFIMMLWCVFILVYLTRGLLVYKLIAHKLKLDKNASREKFIFFVYSIPICSEYDTKLKRIIKFVNFLSKLIILSMVLNFVAIFIENLIRDMG